MRKYSVFAFLAVGALALSGCGAAPAQKSATDSASPSSAASASKYKACMVSDEGGFDDKSFNESGYDGMKMAKAKLGVDIVGVESKSPSDFKPGIDSLVAQKCQLIIGVGYMLNDAIRDAAKAHNDINFALVDSRITGPDHKPLDLPNAKPLVFNTAEAAYLAGYAAAAMSKTGKVSTFGGAKIPPVTIFMDGFADGIAKYNEDNKKDIKLIGWDESSQEGSFVGNFDDQNKGKQLSEQQLAQGSDIIMPVAGPVGKGTLAAVQGKPNDMVVGVDSDWAVKYPEQSSQILTSVVKRIDQSVFDVIKEASEGKFTSNAYVGTIGNGGVSIAPFHDFDSKVPAEVKTHLQDLQKQLTDGTIKVASKAQP